MNYFIIILSNPKASFVKERSYLSYLQIFLQIIGVGDGVGVGPKLWIYSRKYVPVTESRFVNVSNISAYDSSRLLKVDVDL